MSATRTISSYDEARARHRWAVPDRYNIAADVCDRHPREKLAMIHERFDGAVSRTSWGELQDDSNRFANVLSARGVGKGDRVAMLLPPMPETAAAFFGAWKVGGILLSMSVLYGDEGIRHRLLVRWWDRLSRARLAGKLSRDGSERLIASSYVLLKSELAPERIGPATVRNVLGDELHELIYGSEHTEQ